jgi:hypothetical protein
MRELGDGERGDGDERGHRSRKFFGQRVRLSLSLTLRSPEIVCRGRGNKIKLANSMRK